MNSAATSLRQLARLIGVSDKAVRKALAAGVFKQSVRRGEDGPVVLNVTLAVQEWERSGRRLRGFSRARASAPAAAPAPAPVVPAAAEIESPADPDGGDAPTTVVDRSLVEAQRMAMLERARKLRLENDLREGQLVEADKAAREAFEFSRVLRESMLNLPARLSAELAAESDAGRVHLRLEAAIREALEATAAQLELAIAVNG